jgi:menaquinone-specific isochorismate synthase
VFELQADAPAYYFAIGDRGGDVGLGIVASVGAERLEDVSTLQSEAQRWLDQAAIVGLDAGARAPRFFGGLAFYSGEERRCTWRKFPGAAFDLPRFRYLSDGRLASLTLHVRSDELQSDSELQGWVERTGAVFRDLASINEPSRRLVPQIRKRVEHPSASDWLHRVELALAAIRAGRLEKVVLAREVILDFQAAPSVRDILESFESFAPQTTRFAFRKGGQVFLGATPERLLLKLGSELRTEAVAGSVRALDDDAAERLLSSEKERHEHQLVVAELLRKLSALGAKPEISARPTIRQLRHVLHLATLIRARLMGPPHILSLVTKLHPTPAVGGVPELEARDFLRTHEGLERGWYAAPIGWFDAQGDGEFVVGLRSGLLDGATLRLFAGAGIVADSDPSKELRETELKLASLLEALGSETDAQRAENDSLGKPAARYESQDCRVHRGNAAG